MKYLLVSEFCCHGNPSKTWKNQSADDRLPHELIDGWTDGCSNAWMNDGLMDGWMYGELLPVVRQTVIQTYMLTYRRTYGLKNIQKDR